MSSRMTRLDVIDEPDSAADSWFGGVLEAYSDHGYDRGYRRAVSDLRSAVLLTIEDYLRDPQQPAGDARAVLYAFERLLQERIEPDDDRHYVSGGLGI